MRESERSKEGLTVPEKPYKEPLVLIVSTKFDPHCDIIIEKLYSRNIAFCRFNTEDIPLRTDVVVFLGDNDRSVKLRLPNNPEISTDDITAVLYRRPAGPDLPEDFSLDERVFAEREIRATLEGLWQLIEGTWMNHPGRNRIAEVKLNQLKVAKTLGFNIPRTLITNNPDEAMAFIKSMDGTAVVVKPLSGSLVGDINEPLGIFTNTLKPEHIANIDSVRYTPTLLQEYVAKKSELRLTVVGNKVFAAEIDSQSDQRAIVDWRKTVDDLPHKKFRLPKGLEKMCVDLTKYFGLAFGAIDIIRTPDERYVFLEINPNGQWAWIEDRIGLPISDAIVDLLTNKAS